MKRRGVAALLVAALGVGAWALLRPPVVEVSAGADLRSALRDAPAGALVVLGPGEHVGPLTIDKPLTVKGEPGASVVVPGDAPAAALVRADGVTVEDLTTRGGASGIVVREVEGVTLRAVIVENADLHGIEIIDASGRVSAARVTGLQHPMAQGIEVRNSDGRPDSVIENSTVTGGMEGIVAHVAELTIRDNVVTETTMRGITVTEMSDGVVIGNTVKDVTGAGMYCGDMSRCQFERNVVTGVAGDSNGRSTAGWGLVVTYHAAASSEGDALEGAAGARFASIGGDFRRRSPLEPGQGWQAIVPAGLATTASLGVVGLLYLCAAPLARGFARGISSDRDVRGPTWLLSLAIVGLGVQSFHMFEHTLQFFRVRVDGIPSRGGIVGPRIEGEWIHFAYNAAVLVGFLLIAWARRAGWKPPGRADVGDRILLVGAAIQGYHVVEHSTKLAQHVASGAKVNHGILGGEIDLVLLHFAVNLAVYVCAVGAGIAYLRGMQVRKQLRRRALSYG